MWPACARARCSGSVDAARGDDVIVLDQDGVEQTEAVVDAAAAAHGILLEGAQARRRLARVDDARLGAGDRGDVAGGQRGDAAEVAEKVERRRARP